MAVRTISRDTSNSRVVLVWPEGVCPDGVAVNNNGAHYAFVEGAIVQPVALDAGQFKAAFSFVPNSGSIAEYELTKLNDYDTE